MQKEREICPPEIGLTKKRELRVKTNVFRGWKKHTVAERARLKVLKSLYDSQKQFITNIKIIDLCISKPMKSIQGISERTFQYIFGLIPHIISLHTQFLYELGNLIEEHEWVRKSRDSRDAKSFDEEKLKVMGVNEQRNVKKGQFSQALKILIPNLGLYSDYLSRMRKISEYFIQFKITYKAQIKQIQASLHSNISSYFQYPLTKITSYRKPIDSYLYSYQQLNEDEEFSKISNYFGIYKKFLEQIQSLIMENELDPTLNDAISKKFKDRLPDKNKIQVKCSAEVIIYERNGKILLILYEDSLFMYVIKDVSDLASKNQILIRLNFLSVLRILPSFISQKKQGQTKTLICGADNAINLSFKKKQDIDEFIKNFHLLIEGFAISRRMSCGNLEYEIKRKFYHPYEKPLHPYNYNNLIFTLNGFTNHLNSFETRQYVIKMQLTNFHNFSQTIHLKHEELFALVQYAKYALNIDYDTGIGFLDQIALQHEQIEEYNCSRIEQFLNKVVRNPNFVRNPEYFFDSLKVNEGVWNLLNLDTFISVDAPIAYQNSHDECQCNQCLTSSFLQQISFGDACASIYKISVDFAEHCFKKISPKEEKYNRRQTMFDMSASMIERTIAAQVQDRKKKQQGIYGLVQGSFESLQPKIQVSYTNSTSPILVSMNVPEMLICPRLLISIHKKILEGYEYEFANLSPTHKYKSKFRKDFDLPNKYPLRRSRFYFQQSTSYQTKLLYSILSFKEISPWQINPFLKKVPRQKIFVVVFDLQRKSQILEFEHNYSEETVGYLLQEIQRIIRIDFFKDYGLCSIDKESQAIVGYYDENEYVKDILKDLKVKENSNRRIFAITKIYKFQLYIQMGLLLEQKKQGFKKKNQMTEEDHPVQNFIFNEKRIMMLAGIIIQRVRRSLIYLEENEFIEYLSIICLQAVPNNHHNFYVTKDYLQRYMPQKRYGLITPKFLDKVDKKVREEFLSDEGGNSFQQNFEYFMSIFTQKDEWTTDYCKVKLVIERKLQKFEEIKILRESTKGKQSMLSDTSSSSRGAILSDLFNQICQKQDKRKKKKEAQKQDQFVIMGINYKQIIFLSQATGSQNKLKEKISHKEYSIEISGPYLLIKVRLCGEEILLNVRSENSYMLYKKILIYKKMGL